jgi:hypothetical protein
MKVDSAIFPFTRYNVLDFNGYTLIQDKTRDKVFALDYIVKINSIPKDQVFVIGNDYNDHASLLKYKSFIVGSTIAIEGKKNISYNESSIVKELKELLRPNYESK